MSRWVDAVQSQLDALRTTRFLLRSRNLLSISDLAVQYEIDEQLLKVATPFFWSRATTEAVYAASHGVPVDAQLDQVALNVVSAWWHFEEPLPIQTTSEHELVRGMLIARTRSERGIRFRIGAWVDPHEYSGEDHEHNWAWTSQLPPMAPSQVWYWIDETLDEMLVRIRAKHREEYGPGGAWHEQDHFEEDKFMVATDLLSRFVVAGSVWLNQRVVQETSEPVERHARKDFARSTDHKLDAVKVVQLRRVQRPHTEVQEGSEKREYSCRWVVDGHWRNQPVGPGRAERRLTYVHPYVKGPDDKPLRVPAGKVYEVTR